MNYLIRYTDPVQGEVYVRYLHRGPEDFTTTKNPDEATEFTGDQADQISHTRHWPGSVLVDADEALDLAA